MCANVTKVANTALANTANILGQTLEAQIAITLLYFASLADIAKKETEILLVSNDITLTQLYHQLAEQYGFDLAHPRLGVAVNHEFCDWNTPLHAGDIVAFIPPVAGG